jgi:hypothetical protein
VTGKDEIVLSIVLNMSTERILSRYTFSNAIYWVLGTALSKFSTSDRGYYNWYSTEMRYKAFEASGVKGLNTYFKLETTYLDT